MKKFSRLPAKRSGAGGRETLFFAFALQKRKKALRIAQSVSSVCRCDIATGRRITLERQAKTGSVI